LRCSRCAATAPVYEADLDPNGEIADVLHAVDAEVQAAKAG
jgi:hypothetical protein